MTGKYKLRYFDAKGRGETVRMLLAFNNIEFEDIRFGYPEWPAIKPNTPFGKVPVLEIEGKVLHQSVAISRYLGKKAGIAGKDDWENLEIDMIADTFIDMNNDVSSWYWNPDEEFKAAKQDIIFNETLPLYLGKFDSIIKENEGYFVNKKLTWVDILFVAGLDYLSAIVKFDIAEKYENIKVLKENVLAISQIAAWVVKRPKNEM